MPRGALALWLALHVGHGSFAVTPHGARCFGCGSRTPAAIPGLDACDGRRDVTADVLAAQVFCRVHGWYAWYQGHRKLTAAGNPRTQCAPCQRAQRNARHARQRQQRVARAA